MWGTAEGGSGTLFITVLLLDEMRTSWMYYGRVQAFCNAPVFPHRFKNIVRTDCILGVKVIL